MLDTENPGKDDFELWSPSEERPERCLFGRQVEPILPRSCRSMLMMVCQTLYHRRVRDTNCVVGQQPKAETRVVTNCPCAQVDFEWYAYWSRLCGLPELIRGISEFNHVKNSNDECVLVQGTTSLPNDESCKNGEQYWYERTAYRLIPYSSCVDGMRLDRGARHVCPGFGAHGVLFWLFIILIPFAFTALVAYYYYRRSGLARG